MRRGVWRLEIEIFVSSRIFNSAFIELFGGVVLTYFGLLLTKGNVDTRKLIAIAAINVVKKIVSMLLENACFKLDNGLGPDASC